LTPEVGMILFKRCQVYAPEFLGEKDVLIAGGKITPLWGEAPAPQRGGQQQGEHDGAQAGGPPRPR